MIVIGPVVKNDVSCVAIGWLESYSALCKACVFLVYVG